MQCYCMHGVENGNLVLSEPCSLQFASAATCPQTHGATMCFQSITGAHEVRTAGVPLKQMITQFYGAMIKTGLTPEDMMKWEAEKNGEEVAAFVNSVISAAEMDQVFFAMIYLVTFCCMVVF